MCVDEGLLVDAFIYSHLKNNIQFYFFLCTLCCAEKVSANIGKNNSNLKPNYCAAIELSNDIHMSNTNSLQKILKSSILQ